MGQRRKRRGAWRVGVSAAFALSLPLAACSTRHDSQSQETQETTGSTDFARDRDRLVQQLQDKLTDLDIKLTNLRHDADANAAKLTAEGKAAADAAIAKLATERAEAASALAEARTTTAEKWTAMRDRANAALKRVDDAYAAAVAKLRE